MDNIAHSMIATALGSVVLRDKPLQKNLGRVALVSSLLAFIPDMDFVFRAVSQTLYALEHRGFTHSFFGMFFIVPLGAYLAKIFFRNSMPLSTAESLKYSFVIWLFGHVIPDYFTIYGVQLLYPFDRLHYDYALMFIIDIGLWIMGVVYIIAYFKNRKNAVLYSKIFLGMLVLMYGVYGVKRLVVENNFIKKFPTVKQVKYTPVFHPFIGYNVFGSTIQGYVQNVKMHVNRVPIIGTMRYKNSYPYMPKNYVQNALPDNGEYSSYARYIFKRYQQFGGSVLCKPIAIGARCISLKYKYPSLNTYERITSVLERTIKFK